VATLFLASGATGLLYQVAFSKLLAYVFGATAYSVSAVLAAFMGGLALGAYAGGRYAGRVRRPLAAYGVMEIAVGLVCALSPLLFGALTDIYVSLSRGAPGSIAALTVLRGALTALVVVVPTAAMGATLPLLSRVVAGSAGEGSERRLAGLYAINTAGGALGALSSAYAILPTLGIRWTMWTAAGINIAIGAVAIFIGLRGAPSSAAPPASTEVNAPAPGGEPPAQHQHATRAGASRVFLALAFLSGFLVFAAEVIETHLLALLIGNSAYAFGLMLAVFLVCLATGAARAPAFAERHGDSALLYGLAASALAIAVTLPLWDLLPLLFAFAGKHVHAWAGREVTRAVAAFAILALPTYWMGTTFPLLLTRVAARADVAREVGKLTVANTVGTIAGSIITGYALLPLLGSQRALSAVAVAFALASIAAAFAAKGSLTSTPRRALIGSALAAALVIFLPRWDMARLTSGANVYFAMGPAPDEIIFVREDVHGGVTTATRRGDLTTLYTNGKFQGDDGPEMPAQRRFAHFPSLFVKRERRALVVGLGTGTTLGTIAAYPYAHIDVAEISPSIVEAARLFFKTPSVGALDDPRVALHLNDGRNVLLVATDPYDLITIELTSVWFAGAASLYSREFYELARARMTPGGVLQQWVQLHHIRRSELAVIIRTLKSVLPHVALFVGGSQGILVASAEPLVASKSRLDRLAERPEVRATMSGLHLEELLGELVSSGEDLDRLIAESAAGDGGALLSTDDNLYLEYATPKGNVLDYHASLRATLELLDRYRTPNVKERHLGP
jgi:spermidine synthase